MAETVIGKDTVAWLKIDVFDLTGNQLQEGPEEGWQVLFDTMIFFRNSNKP